MRSAFRGGKRRVRITDRGLRPPRHTGAYERGRTLHRAQQLALPSLEPLISALSSKPPTFRALRLTRKGLPTHGFRTRSTTIIASNRNKIYLFSLPAVTYLGKRSLSLRIRVCNKIVGNAPLAFHWSAPYLASLQFEYDPPKYRVCICSSSSGVYGGAVGECTET